MNRPTYDLKSIQKDLVLIAGTFTTGADGTVSAYEDHGKPVSGIAKTATGLYKVSLGLTGRKAEAKLAELLFASAVRVNAEGQGSSDALDVYASGVTSATDPYVTFQNVSRQNVVFDEFAAPLAPGAALLKAATATQVAPLTWTAASLDAATHAATKADMLLTPRRPLFTTAGATASDAPAYCDVTGVDINGAAITERVTLAQEAGTAACVKFYASITSIAFAAADGTGATIAVGTTAALGFRKKASILQAGPVVVYQSLDGAVVTNGTLIVPASALPNGGFTPNSEANGARNYVVGYVPDASVQTLKNLISSTVQFVIIARTR